MSYSAPIDRTNPTAFLFLIDQSGSMDEIWHGQTTPTGQVVVVEGQQRQVVTGGTTKAVGVSDAINRIFYELVLKCSKGEEIRDYFHIGVVGYGNDAHDALSHLSSELFKPVSLIGSKPLRVEDRTKKIPDGAGGIVEQTVKFPVWFDPLASGGTPMKEAIELGGHALADWCNAHLASYPPIVINITDGEPTTGDPGPKAEDIKRLNTDDGNVLLLNLHISTGGDKTLFPSHSGALAGDSARRLFEMSSVLPESFAQAARSKYPSVAEGARGYGYNADFSDMVSFLDIGTRAAR